MIAPSTSKMTTVLISVAKSELMVSMPTLAKIAVSAANVADSMAQNFQGYAAEFMLAP